MIAKGQRYRTKKEIPVIVMTSWAAPFTGGYHRILPAGESFTVGFDPPSLATAVHCSPDNYGKLQRQFIPLTDRIFFWMYCGYDLCIDIKQIEENCEPLVGQNRPLPNK